MSTTHANPAADKERLEHQGLHTKPGRSPPGPVERSAWVSQAFTFLRPVAPLPGLPFGFDDSEGDD